jgi:hypothetical protein
MTETAKKEVSLSDLHFEHKLWLNELDFSKDELSIFTNRLAGAIQKNTDKTVTTMAESKQNQLIKQKDAVDELRHLIQSHESKLAHYAMEHVIETDHAHFANHKDIRDKMMRFTELYTAFKVDLKRFFIDSM